MNSPLAYLLYLVPKNLLSYLVGRLAEVEWREPLRGLLLGWFVARYKLNLSEAEKPLEQYRSLAALFRRQLKRGVRPLGGEHFLHPVDGQLTMLGRIREGELIQAKGKKYDLYELIGLKPEQVGKYDLGYFLTYYLCPTDYHRVHSPVDGEIQEVRYMPGRLWPVNPWSVSHISHLFSTNERVAITISTERGPIVLVMVGATNVGRISLAFDPHIVTNVSHLRRPLKRAYKIPVKRGDELGVFNMGSTVVVVAPMDFLSPFPSYGPYHVRVGENFSTLHTARE